MRRHFNPGVALQDFPQQQGIAPAIQQQMVVGVDQLLTLLIQAHQCQAQQRRLGRVELQAFAARQQLQLCRVLGTATPVEHGQRQRQCALHQLHRRRSAFGPMEAAA